MSNELITELINVELKTTNKNTVIENSNFNKHLHSFYEICILLSGQAQFITEKGVFNLKEGNILIIPPSSFHNAIVDKNTEYKRLIFWFNVSNDSKYLGILNSIQQQGYYDCNSDEDVINSIKSFINLYNKTDKEFILDIANSFLTNLLFQLNYINKTFLINLHVNPIINEIISYINNNLTKKMTILELSNIFNISPSYLQKLFKDTMHYSLMNYVREKKLLYAKKLILSGKSPLKVSFECGFSDYSSFYKAFVKQFNLSPKSIKN